MDDLVIYYNDKAFYESTITEVIDTGEERQYSIIYKIDDKEYKKSGVDKKRIYLLPKFNDQDRVACQSLNDKKWYEGKVTGISFEFDKRAKYSIIYDNGKTENDIYEKRIILKIEPKFKLNAEVECYDKNKGDWNKGKIMEISNYQGVKQDYSIQYEGGGEERYVEEWRIRLDDTQGLP